MLHHYLKSRVKILTPNGIGVLHSIDSNGNVTVEFENEVLPFFERECKLVLRAMINMSPEEIQKMGTEYQTFTLGLIAHHFDIFNLHEQGLAVYESEINC